MFVNNLVDPDMGFEKGRVNFEIVDWGASVN